MKDVYAGRIGLKEFHDKLQKQFNKDNTFLKYLFRGMKFKYKLKYHDN